ncbi:MAG: DoxX family protein [Pirellulaceae bacterium]
MKIGGWILSVLLVLFLAGASAMGKFTQWEGKAEMFDKMGWTEKAMFNVGIVEVVIAVLFLIPRTSFIAAILLTGYLGGATATHARIGDAFVFPIIIGIAVWIALGLRQPKLFQLALGFGRDKESSRRFVTGSGHL